MGGCRDRENIDKWVNFEDVVEYIRWVRFVHGDEVIDGMAQSDISVDGMNKLREATETAKRWEEEDFQSRLEDEQNEKRAKDAEIERKLDIVRAKKSGQQ